MYASAYFKSWFAHLNIAFDIMSSWWLVLEALRCYYYRRSYDDAESHVSTFLSLSCLGTHTHALVTTADTSFCLKWSGVQHSQFYYWSW